MDIAAPCCDYELSEAQWDWVGLWTTGPCTYSAPPPAGQCTPTYRNFFGTSAAAPQVAGAAALLQAAARKPLTAAQLKALLLHPDGLNTMDLSVAGGKFSATNVSRWLALLVYCSCTAPGRPVVKVLSCMPRS